MSQNFFQPADPDNIPVRAVDNLAALGVIGGTINMTLVTNRISNDGEKAVNDFIVAARLRLSLEVARFIRDELTKQIDLLSPPEGKAN